MSNETTVYRINGKVVWKQGDDPAALEAIINRKLPTTNIRAYQAAAVEAIAAQPTATIDVPVKSTPVRKAEGSTNKVKALDIYQQMAGASKADIIARYISELGMTPAGAQTYYYNSKKLCGA